MLNEGERAYLKRKSGKGLGVRWTLRSLTPALLIAMITSVLVFAMVFISSMTGAIDRMIVMLGSSSILCEEDADISSWSNARIDHTNTGDGVLYGEYGKTLVHLKGVEESYFEGEREEALRLTRGNERGRNPIIISSTLARRLKLDLGSSMTLMLYERDKERTRPVLVTVRGIFDSGYAQLDRYLAYVDYSLIGGEGEWEILLGKDENVEERANELRERGIECSTYRENYSSLYLNVRQSVTILYVILASVALLAAFFSSDIVHVYISRDFSDIGTLKLLGMEERGIRRVYMLLTLRVVFIASMLGIAVGLLLGMLSPSIIKAVSYLDPGLVEYYISSFSISIPWLTILLMFAAMILLSFLTLLSSLRKIKVRDLSDVIRDM